MTTWQQYFEIEEIIPKEPWDDCQYRLSVRATGEIVGIYSDQVYATKQAKYKFKKMTNRVEKLLLGK